MSRASTIITHDRLEGLARAGIGSTHVVRMADDKKRKNDDGKGDGLGTAVITKTKPQTKRPNLYRVLILNDDYTPMEFVVHVIERFFNKDRDAATQIMLCLLYTSDAADE